MDLTKLQLLILCWNFNRATKLSPISPSFGISTIQMFLVTFWILLPQLSSSPIIIKVLINLLSAVTQELLEFGIWDQTNLNQLLYLKWKFPITNPFLTCFGFQAKVEMNLSLLLLMERLFGGTLEIYLYTQMFWTYKRNKIPKITK